ncbi:UDP-2,3-diacylglucosamine diphosphatase [Roseateles sp. DAIF2]|uniref:UDP-2,3-diacylglucosamine diphosphatase n=1 Tax=Roseateles sp. DAIF2 TaxID=2714952 RepID=UPI0018A2BC39|nr:UDP-2,3-diacylglucosamine diphosphatase [Roseateles sp. DAIF2]QPF73303.1 UDP-2,3-diacylglucosamine diphosphatase [Roseateles sp. DAIF2]
MKFEELTAPPGWSAIDFLSDLHLAPELPATLAALRRQLQDSPADAFFLLGDIFEVWIGDDARHEDFEAECLALLRAAGRPLFFMAGNRDFLLGEAMARDAGLTRLTDPTVLEAFGQRLLLSHGDALCLADADYQRFRAQVRADDWQREFLARPLAERRALARQMRDASRAAQRGLDPMSWADVDAAAAADWLRQARCQVLLHGHTHRPAVHELGGGLRRWVLSDWDLDHDARGDVLRLSAAGLQRLPVGTPA